MINNEVLIGDVLILKTEQKCRNFYVSLTIGMNNTAESSD